MRRDHLADGLDAVGRRRARGVARPRDQRGRRLALGGQEFAGPCQHPHRAGLRGARRALRSAPRRPGCAQRGARHPDAHGTGHVVSAGGRMFHALAPGRGIPRSAGALFSRCARDDGHAYSLRAATRGRARRLRLCRVDVPTAAGKPRHDLAAFVRSLRDARHPSQLSVRRGRPPVLPQWHQDHARRFPAEGV